ncbi:unnamed protein product [Ilex paraguariensis]|uniref:Auxilin-related protein 1 n=1 Tax=Ilex paraguariensis TaxID=185542 RepID=A0ABC8SBX6_9AQUA
MDEFGVLVESIGFKTPVKSAPMANLKGKTYLNNGFPQNLGLNSGFNTKPSSINRPKSAQNSDSINGSFVDDLDGFLRSNNRQATQNFGGFDDIFGGPISNSNSSDCHVGGGNGSIFDLDSMHKGSTNSNSNSKSKLYGHGGDDDIFGEFTGSKGPVSGNYDDVFGSMASPPRQSDSVDDLLGDFGGMGLNSNDSKRNSGKAEEKGSGFDGLIPGFGGSSPSSIGEKSETTRFWHSSGHSSKSTSATAEDPFVVLESSSSQSYTSSVLFSDPLDQDARQRSVLSPIGFENDLDSIFSMGDKARSRSPTKDPVFDTLFPESGGSVVEQTTSGMPSSTKKAVSVTNFFDDFSPIFGEATASHGKFQEIEGESEERRRARLNHHMRTHTRMANALAEKNQRDLKTQREQEERHRLAETLGDDIKRWAAGKEGNLRALLSSLQHVFVRIIE